jgi:hypothetical protein
MVSQAKQIMQFAEEAINNTSKALQKIQRDQMAEQEQMAAEGGQPQQAGPNPIDLKMQEHQMKMDMARQKAELDFQIRQRKADQDVAIRDSKAALEFRKMNPLQEEQ